ncbi:MAG: sulfotransferase [Bacteroidota bacterium]
MNRIHIVGVSPRTGTTLLAEACKTCFDIDYSSDHEDRLFTRAPGNPEIFLSKAPRDIMVVGPSLKVDPNLFVICMIRDPRDIVSSKHKKDPNRYWAGLKFWKLYTRELPKIDDHPRFMSIRYEDFVTNPDQVQNKISEHIPFLKKQYPFSKYHEVANVSDSSKKAMDGVRPIKPKSVGKWEQHKSRVKGQIQFHGSITSDLEKYGYEENEQWRRALEEVEPDLSPSHFPEHMSVKKRVLLRAGKYVEALKRIVEQMIGYRIRITHPKKWFNRNS